MRLYFFLKYNTDTKAEHILKCVSDNCTPCFDLEIRNNDSELAAKKRYAITKILHLEELSNINFNIRINNNDFINEDLEILNDYNNIAGVFLPNLKSREDFYKIAERVYQANKGIDIIPIIETKQMMTVANKTDFHKYNVSKAAFGYGDYNKNCNIFPFIHQDTLDYWKWIEYLIKNLPNGISIINSPYTGLDNEILKKQAAYFNYLTKGKCGQVVINKNQMNILKDFDDEIKIPLFKNRLRFEKVNDFAFELINEYEKYKTIDSGLVRAKSKYIGPQEYESAKDLLANQGNRININLNYIGGCFPVQYNVLFEDLFHQKIKKLSDNKYIFNLNIIRYQRLKEIAGKTKKCFMSGDNNFIFFQLRAEPYFRICKLIYKHIKAGNREIALNIFPMGITAAEDLDELQTAINTIDVNNSSNRKTSRIKTILNLTAGLVLMNYKYGIKKYLEEIEKLNKFATGVKSKLFIIMPVYIPKSYIEKILYKRFEAGLSKGLEKYSNILIMGHDTKVKLKKYFLEDGCYASELYHIYIAEKIKEKFEDVFQSEKIL